MKNLKRIFLAIVTLALGLALVSCDDKDYRNTSIPYGSLNADQVIATAYNDTYKLTTKDYYNRLRAKSYDTFLKELKYILYSNEISAITKLINKETLSDTDKATLSYTSDAKDFEQEYLYNKYSRLIGNSFASSVYGTYSLSTFNNKTSDDIELAISKYIQTQARKGYTIKAEDIVAIENNDLNTVAVDYTKLPAELVKEQVLTQAQYLYAEKELYTINSTKTDVDGETLEETNSYFLFKDSQYQSTYASSFMTYGTYQAVIIQFNSYKEAKDAVAAATAELAKVDKTPENNPEDFYVELYNARYSYRDKVENLNDAVFTYKVTDEIDQLSEISSGVYTLITKTLEDGQSLSQPRNINNKYVMAYRISTKYDVSGTSEQIEEYDNLSEEKKNEYLPKIQRLIVENNGSSYSSTAFSNLLETNNEYIKIYDPFLEYKFEYSYSEQYDTITEEEYNNASGKYVFSVGDNNYTVEDFYSLMSKTQGQALILEYFSLQYATQFIDKYVTEETQETNTETLEAAIKSFEKDENSTYPAEIGLETYLLSNYGYTNKEDILKYYYDAASALSSYKNEIVTTNWKEENPAEDATEEISTYAEEILNKILEVGNPTYSDIFSINIDHILINFDDDGDGNPDDPTSFLKNKSSSVKAKFEAAVAELAQEIYSEATWLVEKGNTTFEAFEYIVKQYNKGENLHYDNSKNWDDYKEFNFLLTAEQLASSSDITQDSVSNFVVPFANYVKEIYAGLSSDNTEISDDGNIVIVTSDENNNKVVKIPTSSSEITFDTLCATNYGYHLLVVNEYEGPESLKATYEKYNSHFIKISDGDDSDSEDDDIYVTVSTLNDSENTANINQLFVYLVQSELSITSTLDDDIQSILSTLFDEAINTYTGSNFQTIVLMDTLNIVGQTDDIKAMVANERAYYVNLVTNYDTTSPYAAWCTNTEVFKKA